MKAITHFIVFVSVVLTTTFTYAQENIFLTRDFWKTQPDTETVKSKIDEYNKPTQLNANGFDPVVYAILEKAPDKTIEYLLSLDGNDINKLTHDGRTYLFWAAYIGNDRLMAYLLKQGAKTDIRDDHGYTVLNFAAATGQKNTKVFDLCLSNGTNLLKDVDHDGANALLLAAPFDTDFKVSDYFISKGLAVNSTDSHGNGLFNYAAKSGNIELSKKLISKGIKGNDNAFLFASIGMRGSSTPLSYYKYLETAGLNPHVSGKDGRTPLHILSSRVKDIETLQFFLNKNLDVNARDEEGNTPFLNAARSNDLAVVKLFSKNISDINLKNKKGASAIMLAIAHNSPEIVKYLFGKGAKLNTTDTKGNNIAYYLVESYNSKHESSFRDKAGFLKEHGTDILKSQQDGNTLIHLAVQKNDIDLLKWASGFNLDVNAKNQEGYTALHLSAMVSKNNEILKYLIARGANTKMVTDFEESAFDLASENELLVKNKVPLDFLK